MDSTFTYHNFGWGPSLAGLVIGIFYIFVWWRLFEKAGPGYS